MTKINYPLQRFATAMNSRQGRSLFIAGSIVFCCTLLTASNGAEQSDSGWAISSPSPLRMGEPSTDPRQQLVLRHVLEQTERPLLAIPSPTSTAQPTVVEGHLGLRVANKSDDADGWRPVGQAFAPLDVDSVAQINDPPATATTLANNYDQETECGCGGPSITPADTKKVQKHDPDTTLVEDEAESLSEATRSEATQGAAKDAEAGNATSEESEPAVSLERSDAVNAPAESAPADKSAGDAVAKPAPTATDAPPPPLTRQLLSLRSRVRSVLKGYYRKPLNNKDNDPWEVMHGMLAYGVESRILQGGPHGEPITSVGWLCYNKPCKGQTLMYVTPSGEVRAKYGVGLQGHLGQLLAMLAQCHVSADYPIHVGKNEFTIHDLIEAEKKTCYPNSELTFKLIALQHYIDLNDKWVNDQGVDWDIPRLVREELAQPIRGAACGGTHRLSGLSLTVKTRIRRGEPLDGEYLRAAEFVKKYQQYAFRLQNHDGSLSTAWFRGAGDDDDINRRIKTTGHILEWLCYSLSDQELRDQRTISAVSYLANLMYSNYDNEWEIGPRSHATHALLLYDERVFQPFDKEGSVAVYQAPSPNVAKRNQQNSSQR